MLYRIFGPAGSGKTEHLLSRLGNAMKRGKQCFLIVPEQQSVDCEALLCRRFGDKVNLHCEVLNFERLPNRIAREFGGLAVNNIDKGGACGLLSLLSESLKNELSEYSSVAADPDFATSLFALISRMKMALITPAMLQSSVEASAIEDEHLKNKIADIAKIYSEYEKRFGTDLFDPRDALTRLADELPSKPFFKNTCVFIDSYYTFTRQEYAIIRQMLSQASELCITFTTDSKRAFFAENDACARNIKTLSSDSCTDFYLSEPKRFESKALQHIEGNLWSGSERLFSEPDASVSLITAKNRFDEVEAAAKEILSFVRQGNRFRDIALLTGNTEAYQGLVDSVFSRAGIPVYLSAKEELSAKPLFAFVIASLNAVAEDFSLRSMKRYIKSGYTDLTVRESDALIKYANAWNLRSRRWDSEERWTMDPEGYREGDLTKRGAKLLEIANRSREKIMPALVALRDELAVEDLTVGRALRALYTHVISCKCDEKLRRKAEKLLQKGEREKSEREIQLWKILINIINQLDSLCGDIKINPKRLQSIIRLMCDCYSLGAIPASKDSVTFGDASLIRAGNKKAVIVLGVCDGEFPASASKGGFFNRDEAVALEELGLELSDTLEKQLNESRFHVYAALSAPKCKLTLIYPRSEIGGGELHPSIAWVSLNKMFPKGKETNFSEEDMFYSADSVASRFPSLKDSHFKTEIERALKARNIPFFGKYPSVCDPVSRIDFEKDSLLLSPSSFERYMLCPFSFFGNYILGLRETKQNEFAMPEIGNFAHKILEQFMRKCVESGSFVAPSEQERKQLVESLCKEYFLGVIGAETALNKRFVSNYQRVVKTIDFVASSLCTEFSESRFTPGGFEFKIGLKGSDMPPIEYESEGKRVLLRGSIDRVDTYVKNGVTYVRVVDYKTYKKTFSLSLVESGIDTQLLHYLFAYCNHKGARPAGMLYYTVALPNVALSGRETPSEIKALIAKEIGTGGVLLNDTDIVLAMSPDCAFVPTSVNKDGTLSDKRKNLLEPEAFQALSETLETQVSDLAKDVFCGKMDIAPNDSEGKATPCKYCALADFCRNKKNREAEEDESE